MQSQLDHIVIGAANLEQGAAYIKNLFGVDMPKGGSHPLMGTHNLLMQLGGNVFIEVIAINPDAPPPARPRWYGLDDPQVFKSLEQSPRLLTWVLNTGNISSLLSAADFAFGNATPVTRDNLSWNFAIPDDGRLLAGGVLPYVMQWHVSPHPAAKMADIGCRIKSVEIMHPYAEWVSDILGSIHADGIARVRGMKANGAPELRVEIATAAGDVVLSNLD